MRLPTVIASVVLHVGLAAGLIAVAQKRELRRRAISVAVTEEKKKAKPPKPPAPPKPIVHPAIAKASAAPAKAAPASAPAPKAAAAPVAMNLAMSNSAMDVGPGIGLEGRAAKPAAAPVKVASALSDRRTQRTREEAGDAPCAEEPTKPEAIVKTALDYTLYPQAQADGTEGKFKARLTISADGAVTSVDVLASIEPAFDAAIVAALQRWRFKPAMACGKPVAGGTYVVARTFELGD